MDPKPKTPKKRAPAKRAAPKRKPKSIAPPSAPHADIGEEIRALEAKLDSIISSPKIADPDAVSESLSESVSDSVAVAGSGTLSESVSASDAETVFDTARELLSTDFYLRRWGQAAMRNRSEDVDDFGYDPTYDARVRPIFDFLYARYFRVECRGIANVPAEGRCMLVANHSGTIPFDGPMLKTAVKREHEKKRDVRWLTEDFVFHFPFLGSFESRIGAVRACQENAERLLRHETLVAVFPEGTKGIGKLFRERYKLQRFGRGGFVRLALRTQTPIVPVAIVGAEETNPMLMRLESLAKPLGIPYVPVTPTFPLLGPLGLLPAPTKWKIIFGEPISMSAYAKESESDELLVARIADRVRTEIQRMLDDAVRERKSVVFG
jgi:1-acyl-sn-glycerol-3-phosphate acyltransferase